ncbi:MAG: multicomponent Na+:H+ antiporter subunit G [Verrucomicrobiales bacterium]|jgi:multicomponent Na+:H+ antiporter subunit G
MILNTVTILLLTAGAAFFIAGTVGLLRFPDVYSRLHALTKCDNLGLGFIALGLAIQSPSWIIALKIIGIWILVLVASATAAHLIARRACRVGIKPRRDTES